MSKEIEIGYVCYKGHYQFNDDPDGDSCGTKRVAGIFVRLDEDLEISDGRLQNIVDESQASLIHKIEVWRKS